MRIAILSYPMLFQRRGGLQVQLRETLAALRGIGVEASLFDVRSERLEDYDVAHVFSAINGNHRIVEAAKTAGLPVVLSTVLHPPWTKWDSAKAAFCERLTGRVTGWAVQTTFRQIGAALRGADRILALGEAERAMISEGYGVPHDKVAVVPNGIADRFRSADGEAFRSRFALHERFALCVASVSPYKNQLGVIRALADLGIDLVLIGECPSQNQSYLEQCLAAGGERVRYVGPLDHEDPLLASAYAAADVFVLASATEVAPLVVLESLAAGTPVVVTKHNSLDIPADGCALVEVDPGRAPDIGAAVRHLLAQGGDPSRCANLVAAYTWPSVAEIVAGVYRDLLKHDSN